MNLLLLEENNFLTDDTACVQGRQLSHLLNVYKVQIGQHIKVGKINGLIGSGEVITKTSSKVTLKVSLSQSPPSPIPATVLFALPRPKMLSRCIQALTTMGIKKIILINTYRVEKSFWSSSHLDENNLHRQLLLGLEQAMDTLLPTITFEKRFKPFIEDHLPSLMDKNLGLVAHPYAANPCPTRCKDTSFLAIGPEGGFIPYEIDKLHNCGFNSIHLGKRILKVETALPFLLSRLFN